jgi:dolichol-phosphate mannosyltransferase
MTKKISIIVPIYNEEKTIESVLNSLNSLKLPLKKEIILIDDGSTDNSSKIIKKYLSQNKLLNVVFYSKENQGKGSAIRKGIELSTGDIITIQDADLEYNPKDLFKLIQPILKNKSKVVYGSRFLHKHKPKYKLYFLGNKFLSLLTQILYKHKINDMETCYKVFDSKTIKEINLISNKFDIEPEITSKILNKQITITELPISYTPRSISEGKKIGWKDGLQAVNTLIYYRFFARK